MNFRVGRGGETIKFQSTGDRKSLRDTRVIDDSKADSQISQITHVDDVWAYTKTKHDTVHHCIRCSEN